MKAIAVAMLLVFLAGCNGEIEKRTPVKPAVKTMQIQDTKTQEVPLVLKETVKLNVKPILPEVELEPDPEPEVAGDAEFVLSGQKKEYKLDPGFREVGHYGENGCEGTIWRKEYQVSWLYVFVDCKNNAVKQLVRK